jgi:hypothetical protein
LEAQSEGPPGWQMENPCYLPQIAVERPKFTN